MMTMGPTARVYYNPGETKGGENNQTNEKDENNTYYIFIPHMISPNTT
jgi:hypothetical protein